MTAAFERVLVPFDASPPAVAALDHGIALASEGSELVVAYVVDDAPLITQSATTIAVYDATPMIEALDEQARGILTQAQMRAREAHVEPSLALVHETTIAGIVGLAAHRSCDLIAMGTHARTGLVRALMGSTTEGVLRSSHVPVLAVHAETRLCEHTFLRSALVAVDDSDPADAAVALSAKLAHVCGTRLILCNVADTRDIYEMAGTYAYDPRQLVDEALASAHAVLERAYARFTTSGEAEMAVLEGEPVDAIIEAAQRYTVDVIVIGSHGRRGLPRLLLGSVAEHVVRRSRVPVLVVRN
ncbi:MAG TPA: universal stress protein [Candidatus Acidoferrum sp.]|nr:universal stress protein [Candidatus Acidoferrum sp.]